MSAHNIIYSLQSPHCLGTEKYNKQAIQVTRSGSSNISVSSVITFIVPKMFLCPFDFTSKTQTRWVVIVTAPTDAKSHLFPLTEIAYFTHRAFSAAEPSSFCLNKTFFDVNDKAESRPWCPGTMSDHELMKGLLDPVCNNAAPVCWPPCHNIPCPQVSRHPVSVPCCMLQS